MKAYPKNKYSGIDWLGEIPEHWQIKKLKYLLSDKKNSLKAGPFGSQLKSSELDSNGNFKVYNQRTVLDKNFESGIDFINDSKFKILKDFEIFENDILLTTRGTIGRSVEVPNNIQRGVLHPCLIKIKLNNLVVTNDWLITYFNNSSYFKENVTLNSNSTTIDVIYTYTLCEIILPLPPINEQKAITSFLDIKTTQIQSLIDNKHEMIELLKEERIAIINYALTKGIDPNVQMNDSGIEWLGEVPKHWTIQKIKQLTTKIGSGITPKGGADVYQTSGIPLLRSQNIHFSGLRIDDVAYITEEIHVSMSNSEVLENDVLLNITGASIGRCFYADKSILPANVNQHVCILRPNDKIEKKYLCLLLSSKWGQLQIDYCQNGANREGLNFEQLRNFRFPVPPKDERKNIFTYIDQKTSQIDLSINQIEKEIVLIEEYRIALINESVTGKIDVRAMV